MLSFRLAQAAAGHLRYNVEGGGEGNLERQCGRSSLFRFYFKM